MNAQHIALFKKSFPGKSCFVAVFNCPGTRGGASPDPHPHAKGFAVGGNLPAYAPITPDAEPGTVRSEERRVGKECRSRGRAERRDQAGDEQLAERKHGA